MSNIVLYSSSDPIVPYRVTDYLLSVNTPDYTGEVIINPDLSLVTGDSRYWKVDGSNVVPMPDSDHTAMYDYINAKTIPPKNFCITQYSSNYVSLETWYAEDLGDGTYNRKAEETIYGFNNKSITDKTVCTYYRDGSLFSKKITAYYKNSQGDSISKTF